jgi:hypothetical protein
VGVAWGKVREQRFGVLLVQGKLLLESKDGKTKEPISWAPGVRVVLACAPRTSPDWRCRHDEIDSTWSDCEVGKDGAFEAHFYLDRMRRVPGQTEPFQAAVVLGTKGWFGTTSFSNTVPVFAQTVATLPIAGPKALSRTLQLINGVPSLSSDYFDPAALVRAVNHLRGLGKDKGLGNNKVVNFGLF